MYQPQATIHTESDGVLHLEKAILLYRGAQDTHATIHAVETVDGQPIILAGKPAGTRASRALARGLNLHAAAAGFLPDNILCLDNDLMVWWIPPGPRHLSFRAPQLGAPERTGTVPLPGLVFVAGKAAWCVWAAKGARRPTPATRLWHAPFLNVWPTGQICTGSVQLPKGAAVDQLSAWNRAFFGTFFTHPNNGARLRYEGGHYALWRDLLDGKFKRFPSRALVRSPDLLVNLLRGVQHA